LYVAATKAGSLNAVESELASLTGLVKKDLKFQQFLMDPSMAKSKKLAGVKEFCAGAKFSPVMSNFVEAVAENGRLPELERIALRFEEQCMASRNEVKCIITTAEELTPAQVAKVTDSIKGHVPDGAKLKVQTQVDPRLIGGLTASIGEKFFDLSLMTTIKKYQAVVAAPL
jgi:F-type H+-transporting ATPase subunit O